MTLFMLFLALILFVLLVLLGTLHVPHTTLSSYELHRRKKSGDGRAADILRREELLAEAAMLKVPLGGILLVLLVLLLTASLGWEKGLLVGVLAVLLSPRGARLAPVRKLAGRLARTHEARCLAFMQKYSAIIRVLGGKPLGREYTLTFGSLEELQHTIEISRDILADEDKKLLARAISFKNYRVHDVMTVREDIVTIAHDELLGPLVLSDLYKTGHSLFPVVNGSIDHVVGFLDIRSLLTLESELSAVAAKAMTPEVVSVSPDHTLQRAMALFLSSGQDALLVTGEGGRVVGLLGLGDILGVLFGHKA